MCEWGGGRCDDAAGGAGFGHDRTTPWGILTVADTMAGSVEPPQAARPQKTPLDKQRVVRALNSTEPVPPDAGQGGLRGRAAALQPAGGDVWPTWAQHHPRGTRSCDKRRPGHSVGWQALLVGGRAGHSPRLAEPQPRRIEATRGQGRCPKVSRGRRAAAGRPPSLRTRPCLARRATAGSPPAATWSARVPTSSCCRNLRAVWAAGTLHVPQRPAATGTQRQHATWAAALLGRPPRLPSLRRRRGGRDRATRRRSRGRSKSFLRVGG